jgi:hypothetical protein
VLPSSGVESRSHQLECAYPTRGRVIACELRWVDPVPIILLELLARETAAACAPLAVLVLMRSSGKREARQ